MQVARTLRNQSTARWIRIALLGAAAALVPAVARAEPASKEAPADDADALFRQAKAAFEAGQSDRAYELYRKLWEKKKTYDVAGNLAQVELALGKLPDAAEHMRFAMRNFPPSLPPQGRAVVEDAFGKNRAKIGALRVRASVAGARVSIDDRVVGTAPLDDEVFVDPGKHRVEASADGFTTERRETDVAAGSTQDVALVLRARDRGTADGHGAPAWPIALGVSAAAGLAVVGGVFTLVANSKAGDADTKLEELTSKGISCPGGCPELRSLRGEADANGNRAVGFFVGAGVVAAATLVYVLVRPRAARTDSAAARATTSATAWRASGITFRF